MIFFFFNTLIFFFFVSNNYTIIIAVLQIIASKNKNIVELKCQTVVDRAPGIGFCSKQKG